MASWGGIWSFARDSDIYQLMFSTRPLTLSLCYLLFLGTNIEFLLQPAYFSLLET